MAKAFGFSPGQQDAWSKQIDRWGSVATVDVDDIPEQVVAFANEVQNFPRHLGIHSGGMVICDRPIIEVCPVEWGRMPGRTVLQWDKDDCAAIELVKFDLLGLGMLSALHYAYDMIESDLDISTMRLDDPEVYEMLCRADSVGVFQVESRAQMATLPRLKPELLLRPGGRGGADPARPDPGRLGAPVHPAQERQGGGHLPASADAQRAGEDARRAALPGAADAAGHRRRPASTPSEADQLRRAMGSKRSVEKMEKIKHRLYDGMAERGITGELADDLFLKLSAFASYGFPESHAMSFAYLVYASAWLKRYHPAAFCAALLNAQPMGFYSPQSLVDDARRHGVEVRRPDINLSDAAATLESTAQTRWGSRARGAAARVGAGRAGRAAGAVQCPYAGRGPGRRRSRRSAARDGPYRDMTDLARRTGCSTAHLEALATADAFAGFGLSRREALWAAGAAAQDKPDRLPGTVTGTEAPTLPGMGDVDQLVADVWATGLSPDAHPAQFIRDQFDAAGALPIARLARVEAGTRIRVGGIVTHRQRPATAGGVTFVNLEDETGMLNVTCSPGLWQKYRRVARTSAALIVRGRLEKAEGVLNLVADRLEASHPADQPGVPRLPVTGHYSPAFAISHLSWPIPDAAIGLTGECDHDPHDAGGYRRGGSRHGGPGRGGDDRAECRARPAATARTDLVVSYMADAGYAAAVTLTCDPAGGAHPKAGEGVRRAGEGGRQADQAQARPDDVHDGVRPDHRARSPACGRARRSLVARRTEQLRPGPVHRCDLPVLGGRRRPGRRPSSGPATARSGPGSSRGGG